MSARMNLGDYIGDTRTESLPAGFLKSIKIKYRHEASHVFPRENEYVSREKNQVKESSNGATSEQKENENDEEGECNVETKEKPTPSFMSWRIPSRLLNQKQVQQVSSSNKSSRVQSSKDPKITKADENITRQLTAPILRSQCNHLSDKEIMKTCGSPKIASCTSSLSKPKQTKGSTETNKLQLWENERDSKSDGHNVKEQMDKQDNKRSQSCISLKSSQRLLPSRGSNKWDVTSGKVENVFNRLSQDSMKKHELPKLDMSAQNSKQKNIKDKGNDKALPKLTITKKETSTPTSTKASIPEQVDKINIWIDKSTRRERNAAFNVLTAFIQNEKIQTNKPKKDRIMIALNALERKRTPSLLKPLLVKDLTENLKVISLNKNDAANAVIPGQTKLQDLKTWHHLPVYSYMNGQNKSAMFVQPGKPYQQHFSIHPEWGLHEPATLLPT